jgi:hypothetical protein
MKKSLAFVAALIPFCVAGPLAAHHMAEGIVADDIYEMITTNLEDADSPHLDLNLTTSGDMAIVTVTVPEDDVSVVLTSISDALTGQGEQVNSSIEIDISEPDADGMVTITVTEDLGQGESQML